jgi:hypothetical protein
MRRRSFLRQLPVDDVQVLLHAGLVEALNDEAVALLVHPPQAHLRQGPALGLGDVTQDGAEPLPHCVPLTPSGEYAISWTRFSL